MDEVAARYLATAIAIAFAAGLGGVGQGIAGSKALEAIGRNPEAESKISRTLLLVLVFIEASIIYALVLAFIIYFVH